jgi:translation initiation factor IF-2
LGVSSKKLLELCQIEGIDAKSHAATLTESEANRLRTRIKAGAEPAPAPAAAPAAAEAAPQAEGAKLAFAPKLGAVRRRPPQKGVAIEEAKAAPATPEAPVADTATAVAAPSVETAPAAPPAEPLEAPAVVQVEAAATVTPIVNPVAAAPEPAVEAPPTETVTEPEAPPAEPAPRKKKAVSIDEFVVEVPKAIGRIEGIVPKKIPVRDRDRKKGREKKDEDKPAEPAARAHPQAIGLPPEQTEAGKKAKEIASRAIREAHKQTPSQKGLMADTNRPQSGRSASAGGRRGAPAAGGGVAEAAPGPRGGPARGGPSEAEAPETEERKGTKPVKRSQDARRRDKVELDSDIGVLGAGHVRLERGEPVRKTYTERRRRQRPLKTKRADEPLHGGAVEIEEPITIKSFCAALGVQASAVIARLMRTGVMATVNQALATEQAEALAIEFGVELKVKQQLDVEETIQAAVADSDGEGEEPGLRQPRAPVVTFLGHVDHGKTSLMDQIRRTNVVSGEAGGITQHIGAYRVQVGDRAVTFLDTPGHEAFTAMRARGAKITDIVVLVVAADDGIMPQTDEAINHARAAKVPIVVALNKVDKPEANVQRVLGQLAERDLVPEEWGGKTIIVQTAATTGQGVPELLEALTLEAEMLELGAVPDRLARGTVIEARMDEGLGPVTTVLVQDGTLRAGQAILAGTAYGRVRAMTDDTGRPVTEATPSMPVRISGFSAVPNAGDRFTVLENLQAAREFAEQRADKTRQAALFSRKHVTLEKLMEQMEAAEVKMLNVILKGDVQGSVEVLKSAIGELKHPEVQVAVLHAGVGAINESDVILADASDAVIIGFGVIADETGRALAEQKGVDIRIYTIIYQVIDDLRAALQGMLKPEKKQQVVGHLVVRTTFKVSRVGTIAGCYVTDGVIRRANPIRVSRHGVVVYEGKIDSLKRFKDDAREVATGLECGLKIAGFDDIKADDVVESIETIEIQRTL